MPLLGNKEKELDIARSLLTEGLITKQAFREIQAATEKYAHELRDFGEYRVGHTR
jgi:hypothetical protein